MLFMNHAANQVKNSLTVNIDEGFHRQYVDYYVNSCPWRTELQRQLEGKQLVRTLGMKAAEATALPFLVLNNRLRVIHATNRALRVMEGCKTIRIRQDRLCCVELALHNKLQRLLQNTVKAQHGNWQDAGGRLAIPGEDKSCLELIAYPLHPAHSGLFTTGDLHVAVYLNAETFHLQQSGERLADRSIVWCCSKLS
jgi:hypothetical protein